LYCTQTEREAEKLKNVPCECRIRKTIRGKKKLLSLKLLSGISKIFVRTSKMSQRKNKLLASAQSLSAVSVLQEEVHSYCNQQAAFRSALCHILPHSCTD
jgi:hypothetical protein